jgi:hypothetical protein
MIPDLTNWKDCLHNILVTSGGTPQERALQEFVAALLRQALAGKSAKATWYRLQPAHVRALIKFHLAVLRLGNRVHIREQMYDVKGDCPYRLTYDELNNFSYLRTFALVHHADENERSGYWLMTTLGAKFLKGDAPVPTKKLILNGAIIKTDFASAKDITAFRGKVPDYPKNFARVLVETEGPPSIQQQIPLKVATQASLT